MSSEEEKKFLKIIKLSYDTSQKVTRAFTKTNVLNDFDNSLNKFLEVNKHTIYHCWCNYANCCQCSLNFNSTNEKTLVKDQFTKLYDIGSIYSPGHVIRKNNKIVQHCLCCINVNPNCSLDKLDITIMSTLLTNCATLSPTNEMRLNIIREVRNKLSHVLSTTDFDKGRLEKWWTMLEEAVLGLAGEVAIYYEESIKDVINFLKDSDLTLDNRREIMDLMKAENEKFLQLQNSFFEILADKQQEQFVVLKEDVTKLLQQHKDEISLDIKRLEFKQQNHHSMTRKYDTMEEQAHEEGQRKKARFGEKETEDMRRGFKLHERHYEFERDVGFCDVCKCTIQEENNEMIFCDGCNVCVHQACYGVRVIPEGMWLCNTCDAGVTPKCALCPHNGGAMKMTSDRTQWAHITCAWWIPEVAIGDPKVMAPVLGIERIPEERWSLICYLCKTKDGACIQCSVKNCTTSFHVTCAYSHGLRMDECNNSTMFQAFCKKHNNANKTSKKKTSMKL